MPHDGGMLDSFAWQTIQNRFPTASRDINVSQRFILRLLESNWTPNRIHLAVSNDPGERPDDMTGFEADAYDRRREEFDYVSMLRVNPIDNSPITKLYAPNILQAATLA